MTQTTESSTSDASREFLRSVRPTRIAIVDDHEVFRGGLQATLANEAGLTLVWEAGDARSALELARKTTPDVAVLDVSLPGTNGIALAQDLLRLVKSCKILMLSMHTSDTYVVQALDAGARGYIFKDQRAEEIIKAIRAVARGEIYIDPRVPRWVLDREGRRARGEKVEASPLDELSNREREVFDLIIRGFTNEASAKELGISIKTVETHRARINRKLRVHSTGALIRFAALQGLVRDER
ncbi:MAG: LuxR family transcriptional regulator [Myxococcaceae bacterium]|jgi:DNA-binding NarL/FixJ family response regulator|nr:LuxR family transcriptional regulator [Myxococcaceae bacterium]